ncbi:5380_t:CDS:2, partial [Rhizophagus irregularis]
MSFSEMSFSDFSSRLETVIVLSEEIVKSCQSAKNHKILERFGNKVSEALKVLTNLKNSKDHFFNKENATLLERLINDIENIKNFVDYHITRKFEKSFDNNLVNIQRSIEGSKERDNNNETRDVEVPTDDDEIKVPTDVDEIKVPTD